MKNKPIFLRAASPQQKLSLVTDTTERLFLEGKRIQIVAPSDEALRYLDDLLWFYKPESFLPHAMASSKSSEVIILTKETANLNQADVLINLLPVPITTPFNEVYDLLDETTPQKKEASAAKVLAWDSLNN